MDAWSAPPIDLQAGAVADAFWSGKHTSANAGSLTKTSTPNFTNPQKMDVRLQMKSRAAAAGRHTPRPAEAPASPYDLGEQAQLLGKSEIR